MIYCFDLDNTLCRTPGNRYDLSEPIQDMIDRVNYLYNNGHRVIIYTARGMSRFQGNVDSVVHEYYSLTKNQLAEWGVKYHSLKLGKPSFDIFIDDKNLTIQKFRRNVKPKVGLVAGAFDVIHPGYIEMFQECKVHCDRLLVALHIDPSLERREKPFPVLTATERQDILYALKYVDEVRHYKTEAELVEVLQTSKPDIRFLGDDYIGTKETGHELGIPVHYIKRDHGWSTTKFKKLIAGQVLAG